MTSAVMETEGGTQGVGEKEKMEEMEVQGMVEVKVEPSQVMTVTVDPSMVKCEPLDLEATGSDKVRTY